MGVVASRVLGQSNAGRLRVAQIGTEHPHAAGKWETIQKFSDLFDGVGVWEPSDERRKAAAKLAAYKGARWLDESELFRSDLDGAFIETELPDLLGMSRRALEAGWNVHIDKPPGADLAEFASLQKLAREKRRVLQMGYMWRYHPAFQFCLDRVGDGTLGRIFAVHGDMGKFMSAARRPALAERYNGAMMALGSHLIDIAVAVMGQPEKTTAFRRATYPGKDPLYDNELAVMEYADGVATVRSMLTEVEGEERRQFLVFGDNGTLEILPIEPAHVRIALQKPSGAYRSGYQDVALPELPGRFDAMLEDFAGMVRGRPSTVPRFTPEHDRIVQEIALKFRNA